MQPTGSTVARVEQRVVRVNRAAKPGILADILKRESIDRALVFTRTKHGADRVVRSLGKAGIAAQAIHGNKIRATVCWPASACTPHSCAYVGGAAEVVAGRSHGRPEKGLYFLDTRIISNWAIYANGEGWELLNGGPIRYYASRIFPADHGTGAALALQAVAH
jgi:hypothetical protein